MQGTAQQGGGKVMGKATLGTIPFALVGARYDRIAERALQMCVTLARGEVLEISEFFAEPITVKQSNLKQFRIDWFHWLEKK